MNPFSWDKVKVNFPGDPNYDPSKIWIGKMKKNKQLAS